VQRSVLALGQKMPERFARVYNDKWPIHITHPTKNKSFLYYPDVRFATKTGKIYIFEIMDTEVRKQAHLVAHVVEALLTPQILKVFFIVRNERDQQTVSNVTDILLGKFTDLGGKKLNKQVRFYHVVVPTKDARSSERIAGTLAAAGVMFVSQHKAKRYPRERPLCRRKKERKRSLARC
jgi:hypothetical protein